VSCRGISKDELDKIMPVRPPNVNKKIKPLTHQEDTDLVILAP
jgi:hypothetical protein